MSVRLPKEVTALALHPRLPHLVLVASGMSCVPPMPRSGLRLGWITANVLLTSSAYFLSVMTLQRIALFDSMTSGPDECSRLSCISLTKSALLSSSLSRPEQRMTMAGGLYGSRVVQQWVRLTLLSRTTYSFKKLATCSCSDPLSLAPYKPLPPELRGRCREIPFGRTGGRERSEHLTGRPLTCLG